LAPNSAFWQWTADVYRLAEIRDECFRSEAPRDGTHSIAIVRDREHLAAIREARDVAKSRIFAACDLLGPAGETSVFVPARAAAKDGINITLIHNSLARSLPVEERDRAAAALSALGINLLSAKHVHGKFMIWDDEALLITSFNWLATTPDPWKPRGAEIGVTATTVGDSKAELTINRQPALAPSPQNPTSSDSASATGRTRRRSRAHCLTRRSGSSECAPQR
jgi:hypothetical protein